MNKFVFDITIELPLPLQEIEYVAFSTLNFELNSICLVTELNLNNILKQEYNGSLARFQLYFSTILMTKSRIYCLYEDYGVSFCMIDLFSAKRFQHKSIGPCGCILLVICVCFKDIKYLIL